MTTTHASRPPKPLPRGRFAAVWGSAAAAVAAALALVSWGNRLPAPLAASAPAAAFSADRAWPVLSQLADTIGLRVTGTPGSDRALAYLTERLRAVPRLEVEVQDTTGVRTRGRHVVGYRVRNLVARLPGRQRTAVLLSAHYDSPPESVGAADDGVAVGAIVEVARALAAGPPLEHTVIINVNDGEELGLLGATAFAGHRWMRDVRAFVNLESAGTGGRAILFQAGPGNAWLTRAYARAAPYPHGSVYGQDIFQSGAIPSATDFEVYRDLGGVRGLDVALYRDGYAYHTALDRTDRIARGSMQQVGSNALAVVRELASGPLPGDAGGAGSVYYDLLGTFMVAYDARWAPAIAAVALLLAAVAVAAAWRAHALRAGELLLATGAAALAVPAAMAAAVAGAALVAVALGRAHGWYAHPMRGHVAFGALALAAMLGVHALLHRRFRRTGRDAAALPAAWAGALVVLALALALLTAAGVGSAFLLAWWTVGGAAGLLLLALGGARRAAIAAAVGLFAPLVLTLQTVESMLALFVPIAGRFPTPFPFDLVIAGLVATSVVLAATLPLALAHHAGRVGRAGLVALGLGVAALAVTAATFPYTPARPQRILLLHEAAAPDSGQLRVLGFEFVPPTRAAGAMRGVGELPARGPLEGGLGRAVGGTGYAAPRVEVVARRTAAGGGIREVELRLPADGAFGTRLRVPKARLAGWSLSPTLPPLPPAAEFYDAHLMSAPDGGWRVTLRLRGAAPVRVTVRGTRAATSPAAQAAARELPPWATPYALTENWTTVEL